MRSFFPKGIVLTPSMCSPNCNLAHRRSSLVFGFLENKGGHSGTDSRQNEANDRNDPRRKHWQGDLEDIDDIGYHFLPGQNAD